MVIMSQCIQISNRDVIHPKLKIMLGVNYTSENLKQIFHCVWEQILRYRIHGSMDMYIFEVHKHDSQSWRSYFDYFISYHYMHGWVIWFIAGKLLFHHPEYKQHCKQTGTTVSSWVKKLNIKNIYIQKWTYFKKQNNY